MWAQRTTNTIEPASTSSSTARSRRDERRWARGFLRLWIVSAVIWVAVVGFFAFSESHGQEPVELAAWAFIPPVCALAVVAALIWMRRGFRARSQDKE